MSLLDETEPALTVTRVEPPALWSPLNSTLNRTGGSYEPSQQDDLFELESLGRPPPDDCAAAPPAGAASLFHIAAFPSLLAMKPAGKHTVLSVAVQELLTFYLASALLRLL